jgi:hypothetical protein
MAEIHFLASRLAGANPNVFSCPLLVQA